MTTTKDFASLLEKVSHLADTVVTDHAVDVDAKARFPHEAFTEFKKAKLLSAYVPVEYGGLGLSVTEISKLCEVLGNACASTAMVFAMHQIQVACVVHHHNNAPFFIQFMKDLVEKQYIMASATTEVGVGGDLRSSLCAVEVDGDKFILNKEAPVISYAEDADIILVTCRSSVNASSSEQSHVLVFKEDCQLSEIAGWDTLGFRGTCSLGFSLKSTGRAEQIFPAPFVDVLSHTMHPVAHLTWASLWVGLANDALNTARASVRKAARKNPDEMSAAALRLSEVSEQLSVMRGVLYESMREYEQLLTSGSREAFANFGFSIRTNNVKLRCSELVVDIVGKSMQIAGISAYKNDSPGSLCRHLRDAYGAALMVNNDRIRGHNSTMLIMQKDV